MNIPGNDYYWFKKTSRQRGKKSQPMTMNGKSRPFHQGKTFVSRGEKMGLYKDTKFCNFLKAEHFVYRHSINYSWLHEGYKIYMYVLGEHKLHQDVQKVFLAIHRLSTDMRYFSVPQLPSTCCYFSWNKHNFTVPVYAKTKCYQFILYLKTIVMISWKIVM